MAAYVEDTQCNKAPQPQQLAGVEGVLRDNTTDEVKAHNAATKAFRESLHDSIFDYHEPVWGQREKYQALRDAAKVFARAIRTNTPESADQTAAIRKVREALMTANASIALEGRS